MACRAVARSGGKVVSRRPPSFHYGAAAFALAALRAKAGARGGGRTCKVPFSGLPFVGISMPFIAHRVADKSYLCQCKSLFCVQLAAKQCVQKACNPASCANVVQTKYHTGYSAKVVQTPALKSAPAIAFAGWLACGQTRRRSVRGRSGRATAAGQRERQERRLAEGQAAQAAQGSACRCAWHRDFAVLILHPEWRRPAGYSGDTGGSGRKPSGCACVSSGSNFECGLAHWSTFVILQPIRL